MIRKNSATRFSDENARCLASYTKKGYANLEGNNVIFLDDDYKIVKILN